MAIGCGELRLGRWATDGACLRTEVRALAAEALRRPVVRAQDGPGGV